MPKLTAHPHISVVDLWQRPNRKGLGKRWWFRVKVDGRCVSMAFLDKERRAGMRWAEDQRTLLRKGLFETGRAPLDAVITAHLAARDGAARGKGDRASRAIGQGGCGDHFLAEIRRLGAGMKEAGIVDLMAHNAVSSSLKWLNALEISPVTRKRYALHVRSLGKTAMEVYKLKGNPLESVKVERPQLDPPPIFTIDESRLLVSDPVIKDRYGSMIALMLYAGLRLREAAWLRWSDIDFDAMTIRIEPPTEAERKLGARVKRNKTRDAILVPELADILRTLKPKSDGYLQPEVIRNMYNADHSRSLNKALGLVGIPVAGRHCHSLRHTFATLALAAGMGDLMLQHALGHASKELTLHYSQQAARLKSRTHAEGWPPGEITLRRQVADKGAVAQ